MATRDGSDDRSVRAADPSGQSGGGEAVDYPWQDPNGQTAWEGRVDELLYAGESIRERVHVDGHELVVTSHRVLQFTPDAVDGPRFRQVDRPNVATVRLQTSESLGLLFWSLAFAVVGAALVVVAFSYEFGGVVPDLNGGGPGMGAVQGTVEAIESLLSVFELFLLVTGVLTIVVGLVAFGWYVRTRTQRLVVAVVGARDLTIPRPAEGADAAVAALETAIAGRPSVEAGSLVGIRPDGDDEAARSGTSESAEDD